MTTQEKTPEAWQGDEGKATETQPLSKGTDPMKTTDTTVPAAAVATAAGFVVQPESLLMLSLCNADEAHNIDRSRYLITAPTGAPVTQPASQPEDLDAIARATPCKYADCDGGSHEAVTPPEEWWHEAVTASFDDGIVTASICDMRGQFEGYIDFEGNGTMTAAEFRTAATEYEAFPAWLRAMADRLDALSATVAPVAPAGWNRCAGSLQTA